MDRFILTDAQWTKMQPVCREKATDPGRTGVTAACFRGRVVDHTHRQSMAGLTGIVRELELGFQALPRLGQSRGLQAHVRCLVR